MQYTSPLWTFIELAPFARAREAYDMDDDEVAALQAVLLQDPAAGDVVPGSGGCRKLRWRAQGRGKRGGYRVVYFLRVSVRTFVLVTLYAKNVHRTVDPRLLNALKTRYEDGQNDC